MAIQKILLTVLFFTVTACTSSTREATNKIVQPQKIVSPTISQEKEKFLKRVVAIGRFSDETKRGNSFLVDSKNNRIGKQASDILSSRLTDSGKFIMLERADLRVIDGEMALKNDELSLIGADFIILGSVSEYGRSTTSDVGIFSRNKKQQAQVTVNVRLINTKTSQVLYAEEATGIAVVEANNVFGVGERSGYDSSLDDKALSAAISKLVSNIMENLMDSPWQAYLLSTEGNRYFMSGGKEQGLKVGDKLQVLLRGKKVKNPQTGQSIELPGLKVATIKVSQFVGEGVNALSLVKLESGSINANNLVNYVVQELEGDK